MVAKSSSLAGGALFVIVIAAVVVVVVLVVLPELNKDEEDYIPNTRPPAPPTGGGGGGTGSGTGGGTPPRPSAPVTPKCNTEADCKSGERCDTSGKCIVTCDSNANCRTAGETCSAAGVCSVGAVGTANTAATDEVQYGDTIRLYNNYDLKGWLQPLGPSRTESNCAGYGAKAGALAINYIYPNQADWRVVAAQPGGGAIVENTAKTGPVKYGDEVVLLSTDHGALAVCGPVGIGHPCHLSVAVGQTDVSLARWKVKGPDKAAGTTVKHNDMLQLQNTYSDGHTNSYLATCGAMTDANGKHFAYYVTLRSDRCGSAGVQEASGACTDPHPVHEWKVFLQPNE